MQVDEMRRLSADDRIQRAFLVDSRFGKDGRKHRAEIVGDWVGLSLHSSASARSVGPCLTQTKEWNPR